MSGSPDRFLARYANCIFWMSRYLERTENLARLLDVTHSFSAASENAQNWQSVLTLHCDEETYAESYDVLDAKNVITFYLSDANHDNSIYSCLKQARDNASQLRAVISTEMWVQINVMYNFMRDISDQSIALEELGPLLSRIRRQCQTHGGIADGGLYRDQGWTFYQLGRLIERADQITRLLDIKYHLLLPSTNTVGSTIDAAQWFGLLRAASAYHAFRREHPHIISPTTVAGFLLLDRRFPRSLAFCIDELSRYLSDLQHQHHLKNTEDIYYVNQNLIAKLSSQSIESIIVHGLHEYLDELQQHLIAITTQLTRKMFG